MKGNIYENAGSHWNETVFPYTEAHLKNCYDSSTWNVKISEVQTDLPTSVYCRAPGKFHEMQACRERLDTCFGLFFRFRDICDILKVQY